VEGITANRELLRERVQNSIGLVTALSPALGYENASAVAQEALTTGRGVVELVLEKKLLSPAQIDDLLSVTALTSNTRTP
jgi:aspartate ammonia-lyase